MKCHKNSCLLDLWRRHPLKEHTCQSSQLDTAGDVVIKGDLPIGAVAFCNWIHGLGTQPKSWEEENSSSQKVKRTTERLLKITKHSILRLRVLLIHNNSRIQKLPSWSRFRHFFKKWPFPIPTHCCQRLLQFLRIHRPTPVAVKTGEVLSPAVQDRPEFLKFTETHRAWQISLNCN